MAGHVRGELVRRNGVTGLRRGETAIARDAATLTMIIGTTPMSGEWINVTIATRQALHRASLVFQGKVAEIEDPHAPSRMATRRR